MEITPRMKQILLVLLQERKPISVKCLAEKIGVSKRTTQRELEFINNSLKPFSIRFFSKTGVGVWLEGPTERKQELQAVLQGGDGYDAANREERRKRLILEILKEKGLKKLYYYSSQFGVSEATVSTDLEAIEGWLQEYQLLVVRKPGSGICIQGSEESYRRAIRAFIRENIDTQMIRRAYEETYDEADTAAACCETIKRSSIGEILSDDIIRRVVGCIAHIDNARVLNLTENSYMGLMIHITIAVNRMMKHEVIGEDERAGIKTAADDEDFLLAKAIAAELEREFCIAIPEVELIYIWLHIKGSKHEKIESEMLSDSMEEHREMQQLVNEMIDAFDLEYAYFLKQDEEFIQGLLAHLKPTIVRLVHGMMIQNPVLKEIQENYPDIYEKCKRVAAVLEKRMGKRAPAEEIGFLTVHFGAAMVRLEGRKEQLRKVQIGVVCSSGIGISRLMATRLRHAFGSQVDLMAYGKNDVTPYVEAKTDFFVTSVPLEKLQTPVLDVNPLLSEENMENIRRMIYKFERLPKKQKGEDAFSLQLEEINLMAMQIRLILKYLKFFQVSPQITFERLLEVVSEQMSSYSDYREMIQEDLRKREQISSQVFAEFGFALLHTRTEGVTRPSFAVCMTTEKKAFLDPYFKGISVVIVMLVPCDKNLRMNNDIMGYVSSMLIEDYEFLEVLNRGEREEIQEALSCHLKRYFSKYIAKVS